MSDAVRAIPLVGFADEKLRPVAGGGAVPVTDRYPFHTHRRCNEWTDVEAAMLETAW